ncbi:MAG: hypothetical protein PHW03_07230 [Eubacteriales bacterium]|nr:hypothetical protein [Eubacteriales bacterium]
MAKIYADLCEAGKRTCIGVEGMVPVPSLWFNATVAELISRGRLDLVPQA